jgi:hypothetical protein
LLADREPPVMVSHCDTTGPDGQLTGGS